MVAKKTAVQHPATGRSTGTSVTPDASKAPKAPKETATGKKSAAVREAAEKTAAKKTAPKKAAPKKAAAKKATAHKAAHKKATASAPSEGAESPPEGKRTTKKATAGKAGTVTGRKGAKKTAEDADETARTTGATTVVAKKTQGTATKAEQPGAVPKARGAAEPGELAVRPGEDPWTADEVAEARAELQSEALRLGSEIASAEEGLAGLMRDSGDGAGDDDADTGTKNITREHEMALAANAREMLVQTERALERLDAGTYGLCENCGNPIGKARMQAFPRATLCVECKQKQERRS
jgi:RNA polymerase-binding protein DksA